MANINNLSELRKMVDDTTIIKCFTEFLMEMYGDYQSHDKSFTCNYLVKKGNDVIAEFSNKNHALLFIEALEGLDKRIKYKLIEIEENID